MTVNKPCVLDPDDGLKVDRIRIGNYSGLLLAAYNTPAMIEGLRQFFFIGWTADTIVVRSQDREVHCLVIDQDEVIYLKRYHMTGIRPLLRTILSLNKAQKAWCIGRRLLCRGIDTPLPIAILKRHVSSFSSEFVCITRGLSDAVDLYQAVLLVQGKNPTEQKKKKRLVKAVAQFVARLHRHNIYHGDFSADNILVRGNGDVEEIQVYLIDLDAVRTGYWISERRRIKNLEELGRNFLDLRAISMADRVRFLKVYMTDYTRSKDSLCKFFRKVQHRTEKRLAHFGQSFEH
ncbi:MAG: lipopolysaccharide kinase InaA family protein [Thermodesulfobacteriota bacterium]